MFGDDKEEDLLASLSKLTYHFKRYKDEDLRVFFARWEESLRKVREHSVDLPDRYLGFLLINALALTDQDIKNLLNFTKGSILPNEIKIWARKSEMKLQASQIGLDKDKDKRAGGASSRSAAMHYIEDTEDVDDELYLVEEALNELQGEENSVYDETTLEEDDVLEEHEAAEILNTMLQGQKPQKRTFTQSLKTKKAKELARGFGNWKDRKPGNFQAQGGQVRGGNQLHATGRLRGGTYKMSLEEVKARTRCTRCQQIGHWHKDPECPKNKPVKETHFLESEEAIFCGLLEPAVPGELPGPVDAETDPVPKATGMKVDSVAAVQSDMGQTATDPIFDLNSESSFQYKDRMADLVDWCDESSGLGGVLSGFGNSGSREILWSEDSRKSSVSQLSNPEETLCGTIDTGCQRMAIGSETLYKLQEGLPDELQVGRLKQEFNFRSVHGKSTTSHVATIPTSLGKQGSVLKPAIFTGENSEKAPFLISLPFLLSCRTVLHLDPSQDLRAEFKQLGFSVKCHIGPTGALRIPLANFNKQQLEKLKHAQNEIRKKRNFEEFEVLRTEHAAGDESEAPAGSKPSSPERHSAEGSPGSHDPRRSSQEEPLRGERGQQLFDDVMAEDCREAALPVVQGDHYADAPGLCQGRPHQPQQALQCLEEQAHRDGRHRERDDARTLRSGEPPELSACVGTAIPDTQSGTEHDEFGLHQRGALPHAVPDREVRRTSSMSTWSSLSSMDHQEGGPEPRSSLLEVSGEPGKSMQDLCLVQLSTGMEGGGTSEVPQSGVCGYLQQPDQQGKIVRNNINKSIPTTERSEDLPTHGHRQDGDQCLRDQGAMPPVQHHGGRPQEDRGGDRRGEPEEDKRYIDLYDSGNNRCGDGGGAEGPPSMASGPRTEFRVEKPPELDAELMQLVEHSRSKQMARLERQMEASLDRAHGVWSEVMSLLAQSSKKSEQIGLAKLSSCCGVQSCPVPKDRRKFTRLAGVLDKDVKQAKTVAEVFNPGRFIKESPKHRLIPGQAFDLELGNDLLKVGARREVRRYVQDVKPGLVVISPPCTMFSIMQNMNHKRNRNLGHEHARFVFQKLCEAKVLLRFGEEIAEMVMSYGGIFVFEQPLTSKAWEEPELQRLMMKDNVFLAKGDQCCFGLRALNGKFFKKPTGWCTNSEVIAEALDQKCDGSHEHELVLGSDAGGSRSRQAQRYPQALINTILKAYRKQLSQENLTVRFFDSQLLAREQQVYYNIITELQYKPEYDHTETEIFAAEAEERGDNINAEEDNIDEDEEQIYKRLPREKPFSLKQLVRRAHEGLGHPGNDKLARILNDAGAHPDAVKIAKELECAVCQQHQKLFAPRAAAPPREWHFNQVVGIDTVWLPTIDNKTRMALNILCWSSRFQMVIPLHGHTPGEARRAYLRWVRLFGPPEKLMTDLGREFQGAFEIGAEMDATYIEPSALEMPTQRSITERAGKQFKEVLLKAMMQYACQNEAEWMELIDITMMTCNRLANKSGYSPIQRVLGYTPRIPGGLMTGGGNDLSALSSMSGGDVQIQRAAAMRLAAAKAFHEADCNQALRNSLHAGHRPVRQFEVGQMVYFWRKGMDLKRKDRPEYWRGPARVVLTSPPNSIWVVYRGYVVKAAPEHLRHASEEERFSLSQWIEDIAQTRDDIQRAPRRGYIDLTKLEIPDEKLEVPAIEAETEVIPKTRLTGKTKPDQVVPRGAPTDEWRYDPTNQLLIRVHRLPRVRLFHPREAHMDCPVDITRIQFPRRTMMVAQVSGEAQEVQDTWNGEEKGRIDYPQWTGTTTFQLDPEESDAEEASPEKNDSEATQFGATLPSYPEIKNDEATTPEIVEDRAEPLVGRSEIAEHDMTEEHEDENMESRGTTRGAEEMESEAENGEPSAKRLRAEFLEIFHQTIEKAMQNKMKKEIQFKQLETELKEKFMKAIQKEVRNNIETGAYEVLDAKESEHIRRTKGDKIVKSRYVLTEKTIEPEDVPAAVTEQIAILDEPENPKKAKARHVMKGFSEEHSEYLEVTTPQVSRDSVVFVLQLLSSLRWIPGYLDFTQAFHSGDPLAREIYAELPPEGLPGVHSLNY